MWKRKATIDKIRTPKLDLKKAVITNAPVRFYPLATPSHHIQTACSLVRFIIQNRDSAYFKKNSIAADTLINDAISLAEYMACKPMKDLLNQADNQQNKK